MEKELMIPEATSTFSIAGELMQLFYQGRILQHYQEVLHIELR